jgi:tetratricopeptide (TPR) repeat protein
VTAALLALALAALDPCAPVVPSSAPDPAAAALYRATGDAERAAGARETAIAAYRAAAALDPDDAASREALRALCAAGAPSTDAFQEGLRRMDGGDLRGAVAAFEPLRRRGDGSAALLEGICRFELGEYDEAAPLLRAAEEVPEHEQVARFYLGLVALRRGSGQEAAALFDAAASSPALAPVARDLAWIAGRDGRLVLSFTAQTGYDSNVLLAPDGTSGSGGGTMAGTADAGDAFLGLSAVALFRPRGWSGPYLRATGFLDQNLQLDAYDFGGVDAAAGWQLARAGRGLSGEVGYAYRAFGGAPYLSAGRGLASAWFTTGDLVWTAIYSVRLEDYLPSAYAAFSGVLQRAEARVTWLFGARGWLALGYAGARDAADLDITTYLEHGPAAELRLLAGPRLRFGFLASAAIRTYDAYDATLGARREDTTVAGAAFVEYDLSQGWSARAGLGGRKAFSNVPAFEYGKLVPVLGISWVFGR